jgi:septum formation protein
MAEARQQLLRLRGKTHTLISAIACVKDSSLVWSHVAIAELDMRDFSDRFLDDYLERIGLDATQSVGAYKLESIGSQLFESVRGDYFTVLGLPLLPLLGFFRGSGVLPA